MEMKNKKIWISVVVIASIFLLYIIWQSFFATTTISNQNHCACQRMIPNYTLWIALVVLIILITPLSYYFISHKLEAKMQKNIQTITKLMDNKTQTSPAEEQKTTTKDESILRLLNTNEKKVIEKIRENKGTVLQSEISRIEGMTKLKSHRAVKELHKKGIIILEQYGKTKKIRLSDEMKEIIRE